MVMRLKPGALSRPWLGMPPPMQPRRSKRQPVSMPVQCRTQTGMRDRGEISNLSAEGCCVRICGVAFRVGTRVLLRPEGMEGMTGIVRWISGDTAGVEFDRPLYAPVVDHLVTLHGVSVAVEDA